MKIGIFDSGLGGLLTLKGVIKKMPQYDYVYLGDTKRVPYGNRSQETIFEFTKQAVDFLFKQNCELIVLACNTASATALRRIQQTYLPKYCPKKRVLGVIIPASEEAGKFSRIGILATQSTVESKTFVREIKKINKKAAVFQQPASLLVPLIENGGVKWAKPILEDYLKVFKTKKIDCLVLGCTHYPVLKNQIRRIMGRGVKVISQDELIPLKLKDYLNRHPEIESKLTQKKSRQYFLTDITDTFKANAKKWFGHKVNWKIVEL